MAFNPHSFQFKTLNFDEFRKFVKERNSLMPVLAPFYEDIWFRKARWRVGVNRTRSEATMIKNFKQKFGPPENVVIGFGDWNDSGNSMRYHQPTIGIGMRDIFRKAGYTDLFLVDEFNTSKCCSNCYQTLSDKFARHQEGESSGENSTSATRISTGPLKRLEARLKKDRWKHASHVRQTADSTNGNVDVEALVETSLIELRKKQKSQLDAKVKSQLTSVWGLRLCETCPGIQTQSQDTRDVEARKVYWNRDCNAARNIRHKAICAIEGIDVPGALQKREPNQNNAISNPPPPVSLNGGTAQLV